MNSSSDLPSPTAAPGGQAGALEVSGVTVRFAGLTVDVDLSAFAGFLCLRSRIEQARDVEPLVQSHRFIVSMKSFAVAVPVAADTRRV